MFILALHHIYSRRKNFYLFFNAPLSLLFKNWSSVNSPIIIKRALQILVLVSSIIFVVQVVSTSTKTTITMLKDRPFGGLAASSEMILQVFIQLLYPSLKIYLFFYIFCLYIQWFSAGEFLLNSVQLWYFMYIKYIMYLHNESYKILVSIISLGYASAQFSALLLVFLCFFTILLIGQ